MHIILGAGGVHYDGWASTERGHLDLTAPATFSRYFQVPGGVVDAFLCEAVFEHLRPADLVPAARLCYQYLKPGGYIRAAVPDGLHPDPDYIACVKPGGWGSGSAEHQSLFTYCSFRAVFELAGFPRVELLEWWDENGRFNLTPWLPSQGPIDRCLAHDPRNSDGRPHYTSIILDAFKEA